MKYISTRGQAPELSFEEAMLTGLARDGGLYLPSDIPQFSHEEIAALSGLSYEETAFRVMRPYLGDTFADDEFRAIIARAYDGFGHAARAPLKQLAPNHFLLELFHGPTLAFKDFAMQLIGQMFEAALKRRGERVTIVGATSGDTGSAAIEAFRGLDAVDVFILFPHGRVSEVQRRQMTTVQAANIHNLAVDGSFDDCQAMVKTAFRDGALRAEVRMTSANSISLGRLLPQMVYHAATALQVAARSGGPVGLVVPTGNLGNALAAWLAGALGAPIHSVVLATNRNDVLVDWSRTGRFEARTAIPTLANAMDVGLPSNLERLRWFLDRGVQGPAIHAVSVDDERIRGMLARAPERYGHVVCPHTACALEAYETVEACREGPWVAAATAHPAKFDEVVEPVIGEEVPLPAPLAALLARPRHAHPLQPTDAALRTVLTRPLGLA